MNSDELKKAASKPLAASEAETNESSKTSSADEKFQAWEKRHTVMGIVPFARPSGIKSLHRRQWQQHWSKLDSMAFLSILRAENKKQEIEEKKKKENKPHSLDG
ncbi:MAG: hypothetical protein K2X27_08495 [Candidatus Obscuribacterales bacterium]|nr:hypothetical protein [Candidatus Obscuribacterales bacterium]